MVRFFRLKDMDWTVLDIALDFIDKFIINMSLLNSNTIQASLAENKIEKKESKGPEIKK